MSTVVGAPAERTAAPSRIPVATPVLIAIWFLSGSAALIYQVLWVRGLGLLFGSTAEAAAITIAIFFAGMMSGGWYWGRRAPRFRRPLLAFGVVEVLVAVAALGHFALLDVYHAVYPSLYALAGSVRPLETLLKAVVSATILLPPAFLMGGTLPLIGQHVIRRRDELGRSGGALYAVNTAGGAAGALAAGFVLPMWIGFTGAYLLAVAIDLTVGVTAILLSKASAEELLDRGRGPEVRLRGSDPRSAATGDRGAGKAHRHRPAARDGHEARPPAPFGLSTRTIWLVSFASGLATLGIQVVWTRLFSQVLQNSAYTYSLVLTTFLVGLALGSLAASFLSRLGRFSPAAVLSCLLAGSIAVTVLSPYLLQRLTGGLGYVGGTFGWAAYIREVASIAGQVMLIPTLVLGAVLPYLLRTLQGSGHAPGEAIGRLVAANTAGAMLGSLGAGFVLLPLLGAERSLRLLAFIYAVLLVLVAVEGLRRSVGRMVAVAGAVAGLALLLAPAGTLRTITLDPAAGERLVEMREGSSAHVAVVERGDDLLLRVNNYYTLGGTPRLEFERNQAIVPMLIHPEPRSVFFLGMGTGLSAGASLYFPVERVVVCELIPEVIDLSREYFTPWLNGLFEDDRVTINAEDGRNCLSRSPAQYDVIISDLFTPWHAGTGNLYTLEHFRTVLERLAPGGIFAQWVPLYQVSEVELGIIARTMQEVFPSVVIWRGDFATDQSMIALIGQREATTLDPASVVRNVRQIGGDPNLSTELAEQLALRFYAGNATESGLFDEYPVNTDDRPLIEYLAPRTYRAVIAGEAEWLVGSRRDELYRSLLAAVPPENDPYLARLTEDQLRHVYEGLQTLTGGGP